MSMTQDNLLQPFRRAGRPTSPLDTVAADLAMLTAAVDRVVIRQSVLNAIHEHGLSAPHIEVCGVVIGDVEDRSDNCTIHVTDMIKGQGTQATAGSVTFTAETWTDIQQQMDEKYEDKRIVGWYHTHPGFGIFLSPMDMFIHENFFDLPWQIALVHDPVNLEQGVFTWQKGKVERAEFEIDENVQPEGTRTKRDALGQNNLIVWVVIAVILLAISAVAFTWAQVANADTRRPTKTGTTLSASSESGGRK